MSRKQEKDEHLQPLTGLDDDSLYDSESSRTEILLDRRLRGRPSWLHVSLLVSAMSAISAMVGGFIGHNTINLDKTCALYTTQYCR